MNDLDSKRGVVSRLTNLSVLLKEAATRSNTEVGLLTSTTPAEQEKLKLELSHFHCRMAGGVEAKREEFPLAELLIECFQLMLELDSMWNYDKPRGIRFIHEALVLTIDTDSIEMCIAASDARALLFALRISSAADPEGAVFTAMLASTLGTTVRGHANYCAMMLEKLQALPF